MPFRIALAATRLKQLALAGVLVTLAGCGGSVYEPFRPTRVISLGDEYSVVDAGGRYTINPASPTTDNCNTYPLWNQRLAAYYGMRFQGCGTTEATALALAAPGTKVGGLQQQFDAGATLQAGDMIFVQAGANDIWETFSSYGANTLTLTQARTQARARGEQLGQLLGTWGAAGARIVVSDVINQGSTPEAGLSDVTDARAILRSLTDEFNQGLVAGLPRPYDEKIALVQANERVRFITDDARSSFQNKTGEACTSATADTCTTSTLASGFNPNLATLDQNAAYVFSKGRHLTPTVHRIIGDAAVNLVSRHPF